jgi:uncharacterized protein YejL (UPF0352 family)
MILADIVRVRRRFQRSIRVDTDINDAGALEGFICPPSAAEALLTMATQVAQTDHGAFTWTGPYGSGKSSLAVAFAALLGPKGPARSRARVAFHPETADKILKLLRPTDDGWTVLPVVGHRGNPAATLRDALKHLPNDRRKQRRQSSDDVITQLCHTAADAPGGGLLVLIDELGKFLEEAVLGGTDIYFFQQLAEAASRSNRRLLVVGILHQAFDDYAHRLSREARDEWLKIQGRFVDIPVNVSGEEQIELIARAIDADRQPPTAAKHAAGVTRAIRRTRPATTGLLEKRLQQCWPLHPVVAYLLGPLSRRRFGQNQRSVFGFLNSAEPLGFQEFLRNTPANDAQSYGPPLLWDYLRANLEPSILASPDGHRWSLAIEAVERCEARGADKTSLELVKTIALLDLLRERSGLLPSTDVLKHVMPRINPARLNALLEKLKSWSVIIFKKHLNAYAIYAGSDFDIDAAVDQERARMTGIDFARLRTSALLHPVLAKRHYHETGTLRWFDIDLAPAADGIDRVRCYKPLNGAAGLFLLLIGTQQESDAKARRVCRQAADAAGNWPVVVGWSRDSETICQLATELLALEAVRADRPELDGDAVARREVDARIARSAADLEDRLRQAFLSADWNVRSGQDNSTASTTRLDSGLAGLNAIASHLAEQRYPQSPKLHSELLNRIKPSSNAVAAQKLLLKAMVEKNGEQRLGIAGFPAEGGLYVTLLERPGLYRPDPDRSGHFHFTDPNDDDPAQLRAMWAAADQLFADAGPSGETLKVLYERWQAPPFGVRDGLLPVLAVAFLLARTSRLAVYLDGVFLARLNTLLVDRLTQDAGSVRLRRSDIGEFHRRVLHGIADLVSELGGVDTNGSYPDPLSIARGLVSIVTELKPWTLRTTQIPKTAIQVRDLAKLASDPNKFLLDDIPAVFGAGKTLTRTDAEPVIAAVGEGLRELVAAYPRMLRELEAVTFRELRTAAHGADLAELNARAQTVRGITGNYRLDAFATRLATYTGSDEEIEGIASLAANKPPRDWLDRDIDQAQMEIAALAQAFVKAEGFAHVKGRSDKRQVMAFYHSDPSRMSPVVADFDIAVSQNEQVASLVAGLLGVIERSGAERDIALAAVAELGTRLVQPTVAAATFPARRRTAS